MKERKVRKVKSIDFTLNSATKEKKMYHNSQQTSNQSDLTNRIAEIYAK